MQYLNALAKIPGLGSQRIKLIIDHFGSAQKAWEASQDELSLAGLGPKTVDSLVQGRKKIIPEREWTLMASHGVRLISLFDESYPKLLREIPNPPFHIYVKGNIELLNLPSVAIVGSRKYTSYGAAAAKNLARELASSGICVVSGLALGIDAIAHKGALENGGPTIAVMGNSLDEASIAPKSNLFLARDILNKGGLLVSELPCPTAPTPGSFPARNRIMAGMTLGTLVIEAAEKSGSLITANHALEFNREVFAVPGSIFSLQSEGTNNLIKHGAKLVSSVNDVLSELNIIPNLNNPMENKSFDNRHPDLNEKEKRLLEIINSEAVHIDTITKTVNYDTASVSSILSLLEIKGVVKNIGGQNYIRI